MVTSFCDYNSVWTNYRGKTRIPLSHFADIRFDAHYKFIGTAKEGRDLLDWLFAQRKVVEALDAEIVPNIPTGEKFPGPSRYGGTHLQFDLSFPPKCNPCRGYVGLNYKALINDHEQKPLVEL